jgi:hypothetical protein
MNTPNFGTAEAYLGAWLSDRLLLVAGSDPEGAGHPKLKASIGGRAVGVDVREAPRAGDGNGRAFAGPRVMVVRLPTPIDEKESSKGRVEVQIRGTAIALPGAHGGENAMDLSALLRGRLTALDAAAREQLVDFIARACAESLEDFGRAELAQRLKLIRDTLRERLPACEIREDVPRALALDDILAIDDRRFWIKGWVWDIDNPSPPLEVVSPEGARVEILEDAFRWRRRDIEQLYAGFGVKRSLNGFVAVVTLPAPSLGSSGWIARLPLPAGNGVETVGPDVVRSPGIVQDMILRDLSWADRDKERLVSDYAYPAIGRMQERIAAMVEVDQTFQYGEPPEDPETSIVVSFSGQSDALEHHLIQFRTDPDVCRADLTYVVDLSESPDELVSRIAELHWLYPVPFRLVTLTAKARPTVMDAIGASLARSSRLLFLSPDVMPDRPGWLSAMGSFYGSSPSIGALGPKLLYEDGSIQHAGLGFEPISPQELGLPSLGSDIWQARSFYKGLPQGYEEANEARQVPAVSGACMMIDRELFESVGGMRNAYVEGEYEDVDLCLRVAAAGRENWYTPDATLFHLEGRSRMPPEPVARQYNVLVQTHLWSEQIEALEPASRGCSN